MTLYTQGHSGQYPVGFVRIARIIWGALLLGQALAAGVLLTQVHPSRPLDPRATHILMIVAGAMVVVGIIAAFLAPRLLISPSADEQVLGRQCLSAMIVPMAILEAGTMVGLLTMTLSGHLLPAAIVPGVSLLVQLTRFPRSAVQVASR